MRFQLSKVHHDADEFEELVACEVTSFEHPQQSIFRFFYPIFGHESEVEKQTAFRNLVELQRQWSREDPDVVWTKIVDTQNNNKIVGGLLMKVHKETPTPKNDGSHQSAFWYPAGSQRRYIDACLRIFTAPHEKFMQRPHIYILAYWVPSEAAQPKDILSRICKVWFVLDQPSVTAYQGPTQPSPAPHDNLTWLSAWIVRFSKEISTFMDSPASAASLDTFRASPAYNIDDYIEPRGGWRTFNEFCCRSFKPGRRPIAAIGDNSVLTCPADFLFEDLHPVSADSAVTTKGLAWRIAQPLDDSLYKEHFANGTWLHGFLDATDYHRVHAPVGGTVVEARTIVGRNYMQVYAAGPPGRDAMSNGDGAAQAGIVDDAAGAVLRVRNATGYQFCQARGLVVLDTGAGLVAVLPVGMAMVSSVILTAEVGAELHKGEELGYFQFGGSDFVLVFEDRLKVDITMERGRHYRMGVEIGRSRCS